MELIATLIDHAKHMEQAIQKAERVRLTEEEAVDLDVIRRNAFGVGLFLDRLHKLAALPEKLATAKHRLEDAVTEREVEAVMSELVQMKIGHAQKDQLVRDLLA